MWFEWYEYMVEEIWQCFIGVWSEFGMENSFNSYVDIVCVLNSENDKLTFQKGRKTVLITIENLGKVTQNWLTQSWLEMASTTNIPSFIHNLFWLLAISS